MQDCADAAISLYGIFPLDILTTLYNLSPRHKTDSHGILEMLLTQPNDYSTITVNGHYAYDRDDRINLPHLLDYLSDAPYFIPSLPMLESVANSVAMGNAVPEVKAVCKYQTGVCEEDGWAEAVYKYVLGERG